MIAAVIESWPQPAHSVEIGAFVVAVGVAELVFRQRRVMEFRLGDVGHRGTKINL